FELHVHADVNMDDDSDPGKVKPEFLKSCPWINSDDPQVKRYTRDAVGNATNSLTKARRIADWVSRNMQISSKESFAPASEAARTMRGDCRQHTMLATAMCRSAGLPARTAIGLVYA